MSLVPALLLALGGLAESAGPVRTHLVHISNAGPYFVPAELTIAAGDTVRWTNGAPADPHLIYFEDGSMLSPTLDAGAQWEAAPAREGSYTYRCRLHPWMRGRLTVQTPVWAFDAVGAHAPAEGVERPADRTVDSIRIRPQEIWIGYRSNGRLEHKSDDWLTVAAPPVIDPYSAYLVADPCDSTLWFVAAAGTMLGRLAPDGSYRHFAIPAPFRHPRRMWIDARCTLRLVSADGMREARTALAHARQP